MNHAFVIIVCFLPKNLTASYMVWALFILDGLTMIYNCLIDNHTIFYQNWYVINNRNSNHLPSFIFHFKNQQYKHLICFILNSSWKCFMDPGQHQKYLSEMKTDITDSQPISILINRYIYHWHTRTKNISLYKQTDCTRWNNTYKKKTNMY